MSSANRNRGFVDTVRFRITVLAAAIIATTILVTFLLLYGYFARALQVAVDRFLTAELHEFASIYNDGGLQALRQEVQVEELAHGKNEIAIRVFDAQGRDLITTDLSGWGSAINLPDTSFDHAPRLDASQTPQGTDVRRIVGAVGPGLSAMLAVNNARNTETLANFRARCAEVFALSLLAVVVGAWLISRRAMRGVEILAAAATKIDTDSLDHHIPAPGYGREIDELAKVLNDMLARIAVLVAESKALNDNIAHELRSPLTRIRGDAEMLLATHEIKPESAIAAASIIEECDALLEMINSMLAISEMESKTAQIDRQPLNLAQLVGETCELFQPAAEDRNILLTAHLSPNLMVIGDRGRIQRVVANLLDNAIKYTRAKGVVTVTLSMAQGQAVLTVEDTGIGIPDHELPHVFDRFYRGSQSRALPGNGLGLGLVRAIVHAHGGSVIVQSASDRGTTCRIVLPAV